MSVLQKQTQAVSEHIVEEVIVEESAEEIHLAYLGGEEEANDNFPDHEVLQGCIWRDAESSLRRSGLREESASYERREDLDRHGELDFSENRNGSRGYLEDDTAMDMSEYPE